MLGSLLIKATFCASMAARGTVCKRNKKPVKNQMKNQVNSKKMGFSALRAVEVTRRNPGPNSSVTALSPPATSGRFLLEQRYPGPAVVTMLMKHWTVGLLRILDLA